MSDIKTQASVGSEAATSSVVSDRQAISDYTPSGFKLKEAFDLVRDFIPDDGMKRELNRLMVEATGESLKAGPVTFGDPMPEPGGGPIVEGEEELEGIPFPLSAYTPELPESARLPGHLLEGLESAGQWLTDYVNFARVASPMSPAIFHEALGLTLLSTAIARRVYYRVANKNIYPNTYTLIVAHSTLFAKTTALDIARDVLEKANLAQLTLPIGMTPQSFISELTNRKHEKFDQWEAADQKNWREERRFSAQRAWLMDEASSLLDSFEQKITAELLPLVLKLYDCPDRLTAASTIARGRETIRWGYLTICGPTTPAAMRVHLGNKTRWGDGLLARFLFVTPDSSPVKAFYPADMEIPERLYQPLSDLALKHLPVRAMSNQFGEPEFDRLPAPVEKKVELEDGVYDRWGEYHGGLWQLMKDRAIPEKLFANYGRFHANAFKVAMQLATIDWSMKGGESPIGVTLRHWARAQMIIEGYRASLHRMIEDAARPDEEDNLERKVLQRVRAAPEGLTSREIAIVLHMTKEIQRDEIERALERMVKDGLLEWENRKKSRGPATKVVRAVK